MTKIVVIGLGPGLPGQVTADAKRYLAGKAPLYFRTLQHPAARFYAARHKRATSFDRLYRENEDFSTVYKKITTNLLKAARRYNLVCYAVPGHPLVGEAVVERLLKIGSGLGVKVEIIAGLSFLEPLLSGLKLDLLDGVTILDALRIEELMEPCGQHLILPQVYSRSVASRVKLKLLNLYPADYPVTLIRGAGLPDEKKVTEPLCRLDHLYLFNHYTTLYLPPVEQKRTADLLTIMARLRSEDGCPWDREQTHFSLRQYLVEEAYEVISAIEHENDDELCEELGDLLLQVVFHSSIAEEEGRFSYSDIVGGIVSKLIRRHPHVFGQKNAENASAVKVIWEEVKADERNEGQLEAMLAVDQGLPALLKAFKIQKKAAKAGFDWPDLEGPLAKIREELVELEEACAEENRSAIEEEVGDFLFTVVNMARFLDVNPELALGKTIVKFLNRYRYVIEQVMESGKTMSAFSLAELDGWWEEAKKNGK